LALHFLESSAAVVDIVRFHNQIVGFKTLLWVVFKQAQDWHSAAPPA
jgi:hypothetical protein